MWIYRQRSGELISPSGEVAAVGYSGARPEGVNRPEMESVRDVGPIPSGEWSISAPFDSPSHGPFCLPLSPAADTNTYGRSRFLCHGDSIEHPGVASKGCIILPRAIREEIWASGDHRILVVSDLPSVLDTA